MINYKFYYGEGEIGEVKNYKRFVAHLKKRGSRSFLMELAESYNVFKTMLKLKALKLIKFSREDGMEERHIKFVDRLRKDIPIMNKYIEKTRLK
mgnify:CR=1 FL=1